MSPPGQVTSIVLQPQQVSVDDVPPWMMFLCAPAIPGDPGGFSSPTAPSPISQPRQSCVPPLLCTGRARPFFLFMPFSLPECALLALAAGAGRAPLPPRSRGSPRQMGPGYECAHSEAPKRICWCPFHCEPLCAAPLRWDAPRVLPRLLSLPLQKKRKCL